MKVDGVILQYGKKEFCFVFTNASIQTSDGRFWHPVPTDPPTLEVTEIEKSDSLNVKLPRQSASDLVLHLLNRGSTVSAKLVSVDRDAATWSFFWSGVVKKADLDLHTCQLEIVSLLKRGINTAAHVRIANCCVRKFGDSWCKVNPTVWSLAAVVTNVDGLILTVKITDHRSSAPNPVPQDFYMYGKCRCEVLDESRGIVGNNAESSGVMDLKTRVPFSSDVLHQEVDIYPGCDKSRDMCENRYNNLSNYLGFPHAPTQYASVVGRQGHVEGGKK